MTDQFPEGLNADLEAATILDQAECDSLSGDIRDALLSHVRGIKVPWSMLSESEQQLCIDAITKTGVMCVTRVVNMLARQGSPFIVVDINRWTVKDGIKMELQASALVDNMHKLAAHGAAAAMLVLANPEDYIGQRAAALADKDQPDLPMGDVDDDQGYRR